MDGSRTDTMDINFCLQKFEATVKDYVGDDPLDMWDKFVDFLESRLPSEQQSSLCVVLERLVQTFLQDKRYHNDTRFINHCIKCASYSSDPACVYSSVLGRGVGVQAAPLYVLWAQQLVARGQLGQAEQIFQTALENQAQPTQQLQHHYRLFQSKTARSQLAPAESIRNPLQNSQLLNQNPRPREAAVQPQRKELEESLVPQDKTIRIVSRSENNPQSSRSSVECVSMYCVTELVCEGSELCFEELRAKRYFQQRQQELEKEALQRCEQEEAEVMRMKKVLEELNRELDQSSDLIEPSAPGGRLESPALAPPPALIGACVRPARRPDSPYAGREQPLLHTSMKTHHTHTDAHTPCSNRGDWAPSDPHTPTPTLPPPPHGRGTRLHSAPERGACGHGEQEPDTVTDAAHGAQSMSHVTPNTSLSAVSATPSRVLPSPTVNTREALDVIMDMFQAPTMLQDTLFGKTHAAADHSFGTSCSVNEFASSFVKPPSSAPFEIYQDENENRSMEQQPVEKLRPASARALMEIPLSKPNETPAVSESLTDDSAMWGARYASMAACPNHTRDFALAAQLVSTPLHPAAQYSWDTHNNHENAPDVFSDVEKNAFQRQPAKLSPILEQSPPEENASQLGECTLRAQGTIVGEGVSLPHQYHLSSCNTSRQPLAPLSFPDYTTTACAADEAHRGPSDATSTSSRPSWSIYQSPAPIQPGPGSSKVALDCSALLSATKLSTAKRVEMNKLQPNLVLAQLGQTQERLNSSRQQTLVGAKALSLPKEAAVLLSERSFHDCKPKKPLSELSCVLPSGPKVIPQGFHDSPISPDLAPGLGWFRVKSPPPPMEPDLDLTARTPYTSSSQTAPTSRSNWTIYRSPERPSQTCLFPDQRLDNKEWHTVATTAPEQSGLSLSRRQQSEIRVLQAVEKSAVASSKVASSSTVMDIPMSPEPASGLKWLHIDSPTHPAEPDLDLTARAPYDSSQTATASGWTIYRSPARSSESRSLLLQRPGNRKEEERLDRSTVAAEMLEQDNHSLSRPGFLLSRRSFNTSKSEKGVLQDTQHSALPSSKILSNDILEIPVSPEPAPGLGWLHTDSPTHPVKPDLDFTAPNTSSKMAPGPRSGWTIYRSPECPSESCHLPAPSPGNKEDKWESLEQSGFLLSKRSFNRRKSQKRVLQAVEKSTLPSPKVTSSNAVQDVPMSPDPAPGLGWLQVDSPARPTEPDLNVLMSSPQMSGTQHFNASVRQPDTDMDIAMSPPPKSTSAELVSDPWDEELIASLLYNLPTPLSSYPNLHTWSSKLPTLTPKTNVQMGECLRVDSVLGQGAFATVYQATSLTTSNKLILKVQKPANPWEFYINAQLNLRLQPAVRHLYTCLHSAHLFTNGSVLLGELHSCGTLLNVVNLYKSRSEKVLPQPLVLYFSICILRMVELLHRANIVHADIKPDNFLLGESFLKNEDVDVDHGLVLIDFGQSIDMTLFPEGTAFTACCMTSGFQCTEMLSGRPWNYQTDYFGIAGTVHCLMFGSYMQVRNEGGVWKTNGVFKRNPHSALWQDFFHVLLNVPDCSRPPSLCALRERLSAALLDNYGSKLRSLKNRLLVQILETRSSRR